MVKFYKLVIILVCSLFIVSCKPDDIRAMASDSITITYNGQTCLPLESFIPQDSQIKVRLINQSDQEFSWFFIIFPLKETFDPKKAENIYFSASVPANSSKDTTFKAPVLPARYDTLCMPSNDPTQIVLKYVLVVQPYPTETH